MCREGQLREKEYNYYKIAENIALDSYKKSLVVLKDKSQKSEALIAELRRMYREEIRSPEDAERLLHRHNATALTLAKILSMRFPFINLDGQSAAYQQAFKAFLNEDIDKALQMLDDIDMRQRLEINAEGIERHPISMNEVPESIKQKAVKTKKDINLCVLKARLHVLKYEFEKAEEFFELALEYAPNDEGLMFDYTHYLYLQIRPEEAKSYYYQKVEQYRALAEKHPELYLPKLAGTLSNLGILLGKYFKELVPALSVDEEALSIRRQLAEKHPELYLPEVATSLYNLGIVLSDSKRSAEAQIAYGEALSIRRQLAEGHPEIYLHGVADCLFNLGISLSTDQKHTEALVASEEALSIRRQLAEKHPELYLQAVATSLYDLGIQFSINYKLADAQTAYQEALSIRQQLAGKHPELYLPEVVAVLEGLGILFSRNDELTEAQSVYEQALNIYRQLAEKNAMAYNLDLCRTAIFLGIIYQQQLLDGYGDMSVKSSCMALLKEAEESLAVFPGIQPGVVECRESIAYLTGFFVGYDEEQHIINRQLRPVYEILEELEVATSAHQKVVLQEQVIDTLQQIMVLHPDIPDFIEIMAREYGNYTLFLLLDKQFAAAETAAQKGLEMDATNERFDIYLAMAKLHQGKYEDAKAIFQALISDEIVNKTDLLAGFKYLEEEGITHPDVEKVKAFLKE